ARGVRLARGEAASSGAAALLLGQTTLAPAPTRRAPFLITSAPWETQPRTTLVSGHSAAILPIRSSVMSAPVRMDSQYGVMSPKFSGIWVMPGGCAPPTVAGYVTYVRDSRGCWSSRAAAGPIASPAVPARDW